ncbi:MAG: hypothetical protein K8I82_26375 [Anaerolineae bacterium]|nr:hypothetical protein [Anaerolineae bacterium]
MTNLHVLVQQSYDALLSHAQNVKIILLHPKSRFRSLVIAKLLAEAPRPVFYYSMGPYDVNVNSFLAGFAHDLANQHPTFGRHLYQLGIETNQIEYERLLESMYYDLEELSEQPYFLVLDEYDASENADDVQEFMEDVLLNLPSHCQVIINSRTLPRLPWLGLVAQNRAIILDDDQLVGENPYCYRVEKPEPIASLEVKGLGPGYISCNENSVDEWEGHLPRLLLIFALERPQVTRAEICRAFWPNLDNDQAVNVFHVTKRRLHKALGFDALVHNDGYYQVNPHLSVRYDVSEFMKALVKGRTSTGEESAQAWQTAVDLYAGPFLQGHREAWIERQRHAYREGYLEAILAIARIRMEAGKPERALRILLQASHENEKVEEIDREIMRIYARLGRRSEAASHYQTLVETLNHRELEPEAETRQLYDELMA